MKVGIPAEIEPGEARVAATPDTVRKLITMGFEVAVQAGAGLGAQLSDDEYVEAGATVVPTAAEIWESADIITKVNPPQAQGDTDEVALLRPKQLLISLLFPGLNKELVTALSAREANCLALDKIPRISRAQKMDVLSSMANIAGYRAIIEAANVYGGFFGGQITAAGKTRPARVLVVGAGVAGLSAIAAARSLGAEVRAFDVRPAVAEQIESLGARFLLLDFDEESGESEGGYANLMSKEFIDAEMALFAEQALEVDIIITTALIPGRAAPLLITKEMVDTMQAGSVVVDLAAAQGGNCGYTKAGEHIKAGGVHIIGFTDLTSRLPKHASQFFGTNVVNLLSDMGGGNDFKLDLDDEVIRKSLVTHFGEVIWPPPRDPPKPPPVPNKSDTPNESSKRSYVPAPTRSKGPSSKKSGGNSHNAGISAGAELGGLAALGAVLVLVGTTAPPAFIQHFTVFILATFIGWRVVWNVSPALHTPLMSVTNAISGIIIVGGIVQAGSGNTDTPTILGAVAILFAAINVAGGFLVTQRMLAMFQREGS